MGRMGRRNGAGARVVPTEDSEPAASFSSDAAATFTPVMPIDDGGKLEREALRPACDTNARSPAPADGPGYGSHHQAIRHPWPWSRLHRHPVRGLGSVTRYAAGKPGDDIFVCSRVAIIVDGSAQDSRGPASLP